MGNFDGLKQAKKSSISSIFLILTSDIRLLLVLAQCPAPFSLDAGKCVFVNITQSYSWCSANQQCASIGGELINSYSSLQLLPSIVSHRCSCALWLGLSDIADERFSSRSGWQRIYDKGILPLNNSLWNSADPNNANNNQDCSATDSMGKGKLTDLKCAAKRGFACEFTEALQSFRTSATWKQAPFKRTNYNNKTDYCYTDITKVDSKIECVAAAMREGNVRHVLYNSELETCRLLQFTDAQVEQEIETSPDWVKFSL